MVVLALKRQVTVYSEKSTELRDGYKGVFYLVYKEIQLSATQ